MPKNVMKLLKRKANYPRHDFDLSHRHLLTMNFGELLPVTFIEVVPDDYIELKAADLIRAIPMVTSPFLRAKQHIDLWYCPYDYLWSNFTSFITQKSQPTSASLKGQSFVPHFNLKDIYNVLTSTTPADDVVGRDWSIGAKKLYDLCGYGKYNYMQTATDKTLAPDVNPWRIAAYNKIWYDEYRQQYFDKGVRFMDESTAYTNEAQCFNFDDIPCTTYANADIIDVRDTSATVREMFQMRYRLWKKDLYTGIMPSQQFGNVSSVSSPITGFSFPGSANNQYVLSLNPTVDGGSVGISNVSEGSVSSNIYYAGELAETMRSEIDILSLRKAQAVQIWRERALTAGNRVSDNFKAHYGDEARYDDHRCTFLGSVDSPLNITDIDSNAQTGQAENGLLGDVAGKGTSTLQDRVFKFKGHEFGVIVAMMSILPEAEYQSDGIDRMNQLIDWEDYFNPVFQDLGLEAVSTQNFVSTNRTDARNIGYAPRFFGYKQKLDKCFAGFHDDEPFAPWASPKTDVAQSILDGSTSTALSTLYVNPALFDRNFYTSVENSEQFIVDIYFDCSAVRQMSPSGLPNY